MKKLIILLLVVPMVVAAQRGERLQPGKMYESGESLYSPHYGFSATVPTRWSGLLPRQSEVFLLTSMDTPAEVYVFGRDRGNLEALKAEWEKGIEMDPQLMLKTKSASIQNGLLSSEVIASGGQTDKSKRAYAAARCSEFGPCVIFFALAPAAQFDKLKEDVNDFALSASFSRPSSDSPYMNFDWKKFLAGKMVTAYAYLKEGSKETKIDLCADGSFTAKVTKKGILKNQNPAIKGSLAGTWTAEGIGETGKLVLEFKQNLPQVVANLRIQDEKIFANDERYFVAKSEKCK